jgi:tetratricopeptide (TPR) repeat protein
VIRLGDVPGSGGRASSGRRPGSSPERFASYTWLPGGPDEQLPPPTRQLIGRELEIGRAKAWISRNRPNDQPAPILLVEGPPGSGRSSFARALATELVAELSGPALWARLREQAPHRHQPGDQLRRWLLGLGRQASALPDDEAGLADCLRRRLAGTEAVVVVEEATGPDEVELLRPPPGCVMIATSRTPFPGAGVARVRRLALRPIGTLDALKLLSERAGWAWLAADPAAARAILRCCEQLPLALAIAGAALAGTAGKVPVVEFARELVAETGRLGGDGLSAVLTLADRGLNGPQAQALRALGLLDLPTVEPEAVAAMLCVDRSEAGDRLEELAEAGLVEGDGRPYRLHDLVRGFARSLALRVGTAAERRAVLRRALVAYRDKAEAAAGLLATPAPKREADPAAPAGAMTAPGGAEHGRYRGGHAGARGWAEAERLNLLRLLDAAAGEARSPEGTALAAATARLAAATDRLLMLLGATHDLERCRSLGFTAARHAGEHRLEAWFAHRIGTVHADAERHEQAGTLFEQAVAIAARVGDEDLAALARFDLAYAWCKLHRFEDAQPLLEGLLSSGVADPELEDLTRANLGYVYRHLGRGTEARALLEESLRSARRRRDTRLAAFAQRNLTKLDRSPGHDPDEAGVPAPATGPMPAVQLPPSAAVFEAPGSQPPGSQPPDGGLAGGGNGEDGLPLDGLAAVDAALDRLSREALAASSRGQDAAARTTLERLGLAVAEVRPVVGRMTEALSALGPGAAATHGRWRRVRRLCTTLVDLRPYLDRLGESITGATGQQPPSPADLGALAASSEALRMKLDELRAAVRALAPAGPGPTLTHGPAAARRPAATPEAATGPWPPPYDDARETPGTHAVARSYGDPGRLWPGAPADPVPAAGLPVQQGAPGTGGEQEATDNWGT